MLYDPEKNIFKPEEYYKPIRNGNIFNSNYIKYKSNGEKR